MKRPITENRIFMHRSETAGSTQRQNIPAKEEHEAVFGTLSGSTYYSVFRSEIDKKNSASGTEHTAILKRAAAIALSISALFVISFIAVSVIKDTSFKNHFENTILGIPGISNSNSTEKDFESASAPSVISPSEAGSSENSVSGSGSDTHYYTESQIRLIASTGMLLSQVSDMSSRIYGVPRGVTVEQNSEDGIIIETDGIYKDDIITHINGIRIFTVDDMFSLLQDAVGQGRVVRFDIYRNGETFSAQCECTDSP